MVRRGEDVRLEKVAREGRVPVFLKPEMTGLGGRPVTGCVLMTSVRYHARRTQPARLESLTGVPGGKRRAISSRKKYLKRP